METKVTDIETIKNKSFWPVLLEHKCVLENEDNLIIYFAESGNDLDEYLISYINESIVPIQLNSDVVYSKYEKTVLENLLNNVVQCASLCNDRYERLIVSFKRYYRDFVFTEIPDDKMQMLIKNKIVRMSEAQLLRAIILQRK